MARKYRTNRLWEKELFLCFLKNSRDQQTISRINYLIGSGLDWNYVVNTATGHGVCPIFYDYLKSIHALTLVPPKVRLILEKSYYHHAYMNLKKYDQLGKLLDIIQEEGLSVILVKGIVLAQLAYKNIALRPMGDVDLITKSREDEKRIRSMVSKMNLSLALDIDYLPNDILHFTFNWSKEKKIHFIKKLWERAIPVKIADRQVLMPCLEDFLLCLILNLSREGYHYMRYIIDLSNFFQIYAQNINWDLFLQCLSYYGLERQSWFLFDFLSSFMELPHPLNQVLWLKPSLTIGEKMLWNMYKRNFLIADLPPHIIRKIWVGDFRFTSLLFPPKYTLAESYKVSPDSRYMYLFYLIRLYDLTCKYTLTALNFLFCFLRDHIRIGGLRNEMAFICKYFFLFMLIFTIFFFGNDRSQAGELKVIEEGRHSKLQVRINKENKRFSPYLQSPIKILIEQEGLYRILGEDLQREGWELSHKSTSVGIL